MTQLSRNPIEGGSLVLRVTFKDPVGVSYEPVEDSVVYSLYALHDDNKTWEIVNDHDKTPLPSESVVDIVLQGDDLALLPNCSNKRRFIIDWVYLRAGEETLGRDQFDFEVTPLPVLA